MIESLRGVGNSWKKEVRKIVRSGGNKEAREEGTRP